MHTWNSCNMYTWYIFNIHHGHLVGPPLLLFFQKALYIHMGSITFEESIQTDPTCS